MGGDSARSQDASSRGDVVRLWRCCSPGQRQPRRLRLPRGVAQYVTSLPVLRVAPISDRALTEAARLLASRPACDVAAPRADPAALWQAGVVELQCMSFCCSPAVLATLTDFLDGLPAQLKTLGSVGRQRSRTLVTAVSPPALTMPR